MCPLIPLLVCLVVSSTEELERSRKAVYAMSRRRLSLPLIQHLISIINATTDVGVLVSGRITVTSFTGSESCRVTHLTATDKHD